MNLKTITIVLALALVVKPPRDDSRPTMPFEQWEFDNFQPSNKAG